MSCHVMGSKKCFLKLVGWDEVEEGEEKKLRGFVRRDDYISGCVVVLGYKEEEEEEEGREESRMCCRGSRKCNSVHD